MAVVEGREASCQFCGMTDRFWNRIFRRSLAVPLTWSRRNHLPLNLMQSGSTSSKVVLCCQLGAGLGSTAMSSVFIHADQPSLLDTMGLLCESVRHLRQQEEHVRWESVRFGYVS